MNKKSKQYSVVLLFCLVFIMLFSSLISVFAADKSDEFKDDGKDALKNGGDFVAFQDSIRKTTYEKFMKMVEGGYLDTNIIPEYTIVDEDKSTNTTINMMDASAVDVLDTEYTDTKTKSEEVYLCFTLVDDKGNETNYKIKTYYKRFNCGWTSDKLYEGDDLDTSRVTCNNYKGKSGSDENGSYIIYSCAGCSKENSTVLSTHQSEYKKAEACEKFVSMFTDGVIDGVAAGGISGGFNIGTAYSTNQKALYDIMELQGGFYEFKNMTNVDFTLSSFYSPVFGEKTLEELKAFDSDDKWKEELKNNLSNYINGTTVVINQGFLTMYSELDPTGTNVNARGERISDKVSFKNGVKKLKLVSQADDPKSILSYSMTLATPYIFDLGNNLKGNLVTSALHIIDGYKYNIYNERIYDSNNVEVTTMPSVDIDRKQLYLYNQQTDTGLIGVVIVAYFDEVVINTKVDPNDNPDNEPILYLTGRRIGFTNGYSDKLDFKNENSNLMFVTGTGGKEGYLPKNVAFPVDTTTLMGYAFTEALTGDVQAKEPKLVDALKEITKVPTSQEIRDTVITEETHSKLSEYPDIVKMYIDFGFVSVNSDTIFNPAGATNTNTGGQMEGKYAFYMIRNNSYLGGDEALESWLRSDLANSLTYVDAETLLAKINGEIVFNGKLGYEDWKRMNAIKSELDYDKDMWLVNLFNITALVLGVSLIIFAILLIMAYWIDIFNTFTEFSIVQFVSMGNLYPVWDTDTTNYMPSRGEKVKYVTFKDILIIAFIMVLIGLLFVYVDSLVHLILSIYNYIMYVFGGVI